MNILNHKKMILMANQDIISNKVFWNQLVSGAGSNTIAKDSNYEISKLGSLSRMLVNGVISDDSFKNHKILRRGKYRVIERGDIRSYVSYFFSTNLFFNETITGTEWVTKENITTCNTGNNLCYGRAYGEDKTSPTSGRIEFNFKAHDLTLMFGEGKEPASVDEFYARISGIPVDIDEYNPGEIIEW